MLGVCYSALRRLLRRDSHPLEMNGAKQTMLCLLHDAPRGAAYITAGQKSGDRLVAQYVIGHDYFSGSPTSTLQALCYWRLAGGVATLYGAETRSASRGTLVFVNKSA
jgi:hypothetical protein